MVNTAARYYQIYTLSYYSRYNETRAQQSSTGATEYLEPSPCTLPPLALTPAYTPSLARPQSPWFSTAPPLTPVIPQPTLVAPPTTPVGGVGLGGLPPNHPYLQASWDWSDISITPTSCRGFTLEIP